MSDQALYEKELETEELDPDSVEPVSRKLHTQPFDLIVRTLIDQIEDNTLHLAPTFQRRYVWPPRLASRLIESILLNIPIPSCFLAQDDSFELDVIDGQQRLSSIHKFVNNQFSLTSLEVLKELNGKRFHEINSRERNKILSYTLRCVVITNDSDEEIKFDVFERLNSNTVPLNPQELRNCIYRGTLISGINELTAYEPWLEILGRKQPDRRMRDEELILRYFSFNIKGLNSYKTPQKHWLNDMAKEGRAWSRKQFDDAAEMWKEALYNCMIVFPPNECFRRPVAKKQKSRVFNRALMDLTLHTFTGKPEDEVDRCKDRFAEEYKLLFENEEFSDLITRAVDHKSRTERRFQMWHELLESEVFG